MKTKLTILILSLSIISCTAGKQPKCSDETVVSLLKQILAEQARRDTSEIFIEAIRTISKNSEFKSCNCETHLEAKIKNIGDAFFINPLDENVKYTAQFTNDGENINVTLKDKQ